MKSNLSKKGFRINPRITTQEMRLKHILTCEEVPFVFQKVFSFPDRWYVVDFFLTDNLILECSYTRAYQYEVALRHKAMYLETKTAFLKQHYDYPIWVFLESVRPMGELFIRTLHRLMPSVDQILTSEAMLREHLWEFMRKNLTSGHSSGGILRSSASHSVLELFDDAYTEINPHKYSTQNYGSYIRSERRNNRKFSPRLPNLPITASFRSLTNYSHTMKKEFTERTEVLLP